MFGLVPIIEHKQGSQITAAAYVGTTKSHRIFVGTEHGQIVEYIVPKGSYPPPLSKWILPSQTDNNTPGKLPAAKYYMEDAIPPKASQIFSCNDLQIGNTTSVGRRPILKMEAVPIADCLFVLSDGKITRHDLDDISSTVTLPLPKQVNMFCIQQTLTSSTKPKQYTPGKVGGYLCAVIKNKMFLYDVFKRDVFKVLLTPEPPLGIVWNNNTLLISMRKEYSLVDVETTVVRELILEEEKADVSGVANPLLSLNPANLISNVYSIGKDLIIPGKQFPRAVKVLPSNEVVFSIGNGTTLVKDLLNKRRAQKIFWKTTGSIVEYGYSFPYLFSLSNDNNLFIHDTLRSGAQEQQVINLYDALNTQAFAMLDNCGRYCFLMTSYHIYGILSTDPEYQYESLPLYRSFKSTPAENLSTYLAEQLSGESAFALFMKNCAICFMHECGEKYQHLRELVRDAKKRSAAPADDTASNQNSGKDITKTIENNIEECRNIISFFSGTIAEMFLHFWEQYFVDLKLEEVVSVTNLPVPADIMDIALDVTKYKLVQITMSALKPLYDMLVGINLVFYLRFKYKSEDESYSTLSKRYASFQVDVDTLNDQDFFRTSQDTSNTKNGNAKLGRDQGILLSPPSNHGKMKYITRVFQLLEVNALMWLTKDSVVYQIKQRNFKKDIKFEITIYHRTSNILVAHFPPIDNEDDTDVHLVRDSLHLKCFGLLFIIPVMQLHYNKNTKTILWLDDFSNEKMVMKLSFDKIETYKLFKQKIHNQSQIEDESVQVVDDNRDHLYNHPDYYPYREAITCLQSLPSKTTPTEMLQCVFDTLKLSMQCVEQFWKHNNTDVNTYNSSVVVGADELVPILAFVALQAQLPHIHGFIHFVYDFVDEKSLNGQLGYSLVSLQTALRQLTHVLTRK